MEYSATSYQTAEVTYTNPCDTGGPTHDGRTDQPEGLMPSFPLPHMPSRGSLGLADGKHDLVAYLAGSIGLRDYAKPLGMPIVKAGVSGSHDMMSRIEDLRRVRYASILQVPGRA